MEAYLFGIILIALVGICVSMIFNRKIRPFGIAGAVTIAAAGICSYFLMKYMQSFKSYSDLILFWVLFAVWLCAIYVVAHIIIKMVLKGRLNRQDTAYTEGFPEGNGVKVETRKVKINAPAPVRNAVAQDSAKEPVLVASSVMPQARVVRKIPKPIPENRAEEPQGAVQHDQLFEVPPVKRKIMTADAEPAPMTVQVVSAETGKPATPPAVAGVMEEPQNTSAQAFENEETIEASAAEAPAAEPIDIKSVKISKEEPIVKVTPEAKPDAGTEEDGFQVQTEVQPQPLGNSAPLKDGSRQEEQQEISITEAEEQTEMAAEPVGATAADERTRETKDGELKEKEKEAIIKQVLMISKASEMMEQKRYLLALQMLAACLKIAEDETVKKQADIMGLECLVAVKQYRQAGQKLFEILNKRYAMNPAEKLKIKDIMIFLKTTGGRD